ncbi:MAG: hypothetical protein ACRD1T_21820, partial [Acidimicrobiia bacterium]
MSRHELIALGVIMLLARPSSAQHYQTDFPPEEFKARWEKVFAQIGDNGVAALQGMPQTDGYVYPRQY